MRNNSLYDANREYLYVQRLHDRRRFARRQFDRRRLAMAALTVGAIFACIALYFFAAAAAFAPH